MLWLYTAFHQSKKFESFGGEIPDAFLVFDFEVLANFGIDFDNLSFFEVKVVAFDWVAVLKDFSRFIHSQRLGKIVHSIDYEAFIREVAVVVEGVFLEGDRGFFVGGDEGDFVGLFWGFFGDSFLSLVLDLRDWVKLGGTHLEVVQDGLAMTLV